MKKKSKTIANSPLRGYFLMTSSTARSKAASSGGGGKGGIDTKRGAYGLATDKAIKEEYADAWGRTDYRTYVLDPTIKPVDPWVWGERHMFASPRGIVRIRQYLLVKLVETLKPRRILEVGCGNGINLLLLAGRFPDVEVAAL